MNNFRLSRNSYRFIIFALAILTSAFLYVPMNREYEARKSVILDTAKTEIAASIQNPIAQLKATDFSTSDRAYQREVFSKLFTQIQSLDFVRIKVWNPEYVVVWSDLKETIGQQFTDNHEVEEALEGEIELELAVEKNEHVTERQFTSLAEVYVPVRATNGTIIGVLEVYTSAAAIESELQKLLILIFCISVAGVLVVTFGGVLILRKFVR